MTRWSAEWHFQCASIWIIDDFHGTTRRWLPDPELRHRMTWCAESCSGSWCIRRLAGSKTHWEWVRRCRARTQPPASAWCVGARCVLAFEWPRPPARRKTCRGRCRRWAWSRFRFASSRRCCVTSAHVDSLAPRWFRQTPAICWHSAVNWLSHRHSHRYGCCGPYNANWENTQSVSEWSGFAMAYRPLCSEFIIGRLCRPTLIVIMHPLSATMLHNMWYESTSSVSACVMWLRNSCIRK